MNISITDIAVRLKLESNLVSVSVDDDYVFDEEDEEIGDEND